RQRQFSMNFGLREACRGGKSERCQGSNKVLRVETACEMSKEVVARIREGADGIEWLPGLDVRTIQIALADPQSSGAFVTCRRLDRIRVDQRGKNKGLDHRAGRNKTLCSRTEPMLRDQLSS